MSVQEDPVCISVAADDHYAPHVGAMLHSLFSSNPHQTFQIDFLHRPAISRLTLDRLRALCRRFGAEITMIEVSPSTLPPIRFDREYPQEAWYRLLLPSLLSPERRKTLWLDADTLVLSDIESLWNWPLDGAELAAVPNALSASRSGYAEHIGLELEDAPQYFSTGVMVMDLAAMRASQAEERLLEALERAPEGISWADQDIFNPVYAKSYRKLPLCWNFTSGAYFFVPENLRVHGRDEYLKALKNPRIVHFTLPWMKPWQPGIKHPYTALYWQHRTAAGWAAEPPAQRRIQPMIDAIPIWVRALIHAVRKKRFAAAFAVIKVRLLLLRHSAASPAK